jgi:hypothetical protein
VHQLPNPKVLCVTCLNPCQTGEFAHVKCFNGASGKSDDFPEYIASHCIGSSTSVDFYFSRSCGIKMDTNNSENKQGAVVPADLLQQKPYVEVIPT